MAFIITNTAKKKPKIIATAQNIIVKDLNIFTFFFMILRFKENISEKIVGIKFMI